MVRMELAVLSDIHGNYVALAECVEFALSRGISSFLFLGDYLGDMAYPERTMEFLYDLRGKYQCTFIRGNKEEYWLNYDRSREQGHWKKFSSTTGCLVYNYSRLSGRDLDFFREMPVARRLEFDALPPLMACHGSPLRVNEKLVPGDKNTLSVMERTGTPVILCGHTHRQGKFLHGGVTLLNAGSVGLGLDTGRGRPLQAQFLILHGESFHEKPLCGETLHRESLHKEEGRWLEEFVSLPYDVERVIRELYEEELDQRAPYWSRSTERILRTGAGNHGKTLMKAMELCQAREGQCIWPDIPEVYWKQAWEMARADRSLM